MKENSLLFKKKLLFALAILITFPIILFFTKPHIFNALTWGKTDFISTNYLDIDNYKILELGKNTNWNEDKNLPLLPIYANAVYESKIEVPSIIAENFPSIFDFIAGYSSSRSGQLTVAKSYFKKLTFLPKVAVYSDIGLMDLYSYSGNTVALCNSVKEYKQGNHFTNRYANEVLTDYELDCLIKTGKYDSVIAILKSYKSNEINDKFKKNLILIKVLNLTGKYQESKNLIESTKKWYGNTEGLILSEADLYRHKEGYEHALKFLKANMNESTFLLRQIYANYLSNSDVKKSTEALNILSENAAKRPNDIEVLLSLAHFSFDSGSRKTLENAYSSLSAIKDIHEFSDFNLLEAKMALLHKDFTEVDAKLKQVEDKNPLNKSYLWFSYQYNDLFKRQNIAIEYLDKYLIIEPNNQIVKKIIQDSNKTVGAS